jgi:CHAD domain-containing protein
MPSGHLRAPFRKRLDAFTRELAGVEESNVEALHHTRVASRRLRELLPLLELDRDVTRKLSRRLRKVTKGLGTVRELDVLKLLIQELAEDGRYTPTALRQLAAAVAQERAGARERLSAKLPTARLERLARTLERVSERLASGDSESGQRRTKGASRAWLWGLEARVSLRGACVRAAIEAVGGVYAPERLHGVRIAVKKLRYAAELVAEATRKRIGADIAVLKAAQDLLGRLHDLEVLLVRATCATAPS